MTLKPDDLISTTEAAELLGCSPVSLNNRRLKNLPPSYYRVLGRIRYSRNDLDQYIQAGKVQFSPEER